MKGNRNAKPPARKPLPEEVKRSIVDRYTRGQAISYIALAFDGVGADRVRQVLREAGVAIRKRGANRAWGWTGVTR